MSNTRLTRQALSLPISERVEMAQALWQSIGADSLPNPAADEPETVHLARQRDQDLKTGRVTGRSHQDVMEAARRSLGCD